MGLNLGVGIVTELKLYNIKRWKTENLKPDTVLRHYCHTTTTWFSPEYTKMRETQKENGTLVVRDRSDNQVTPRWNTIYLPTWTKAGPNGTWYSGSSTIWLSCNRTWGFHVDSVTEPLIWDLLKFWETRIPIVYHDSIQTIHLTSTESWSISFFMGKPIKDINTRMTWSPSPKVPPRSDNYLPYL